MAKALDVAKYLILLADAEEEPDCLSHLRLQKLLYYVQGWSLALRKTEIFPEGIEAWAHGPVVPDVYRHLKKYGSSSIPIEGWASPKNLSKTEQRFIESVWEAYKEYSATSLRKMTHQEDPWVNTRGSLGPGDLCAATIPHKAMKKFFVSHSQQ